MQSKPCTKCRTDNPPQANYCKRCGKMLVHPAIAGLQRLARSGMTVAEIDGAMRRIAAWPRHEVGEAKESQD
jgi:predicted amidophosphoribosyltransferase